MKKLRGYYMRVDYGNWRTERKHGWGSDRSFPPEWDQVKDDPSVVKAEIFTAAQRHRRANKRKILDSFSREED